MTWFGISVAIAALAAFLFGACRVAGDADDRAETALQRLRELGCIGAEGSDDF